MHAPILILVYAISRNGTEPARNIPQDAKTRSDRFYNWNRHSDRFMEGAGGYNPLLPLTNSSVHYMYMILKVFKLKILSNIAKIITAKWNSHTDADSKKLNVDNVFLVRSRNY